MRTETIIDPAERATTIKYVPDGYDAFPPASVAWMEGRVVDRNRDREAVAHALLLYPFVSGRLSPARGCGVDIARSLRDVFLPRRIILEGVELAPARIPSGTRTAILCDGSYRSAAMMRACKPDLVFRLSESAFTTALGPHHVVVSSNFGLFARQTGQLYRILPTIAAALLLADDLGIARLILPIQDLTPDEADLLTRLVALMAAVNVAVETPFLESGLTALVEFLMHPSGLEVFLAERHEHSRSPDDLPDFWLAELLVAHVAGNKEAADIASARLQRLDQDGHVFSAQERSLIWSHTATRAT